MNDLHICLSIEHFFILTNVIGQLNGTFCWELVSDDYPLVVLHTTLIFPFHLWCVLGGSV